MVDTNTTFLNIFNREEKKEIVRWYIESVQEWELTEYLKKKYEVEALNKYIEYCKLLQKPPKPVEHIIKLFDFHCKNK